SGPSKRPLSRRSASRACARSCGAEGVAGLGAGPLARGRSQLGAPSGGLGAASDQQPTPRPAPRGGAAPQNPAPPTPHHQVMLERIERILSEDCPALPRYRAEEDAGWPAWQARSPGDVLGALRELRARLLARIEGLSDEEVTRLGVHSTFGPMSLSSWLEF